MIQLAVSEFDAFDTVMGKSQLRLGFKARYEPFHRLDLCHKVTLNWCYSICESIKKVCNSTWKYLNCANIIYLMNFLMYCRMRVMWMYWFTMYFCFKHGRAKSEKDIEQHISSIKITVLVKFYTNQNEAKMCVCYKSVLKLGTALLLKIWEFIW